MFECKEICTFVNTTVQAMLFHAFDNQTWMDSSLLDPASIISSRQAAIPGKSVGLASIVCYNKTVASGNVLFKPNADEQHSTEKFGSETKLSKSLIVHVKPACLDLSVEGRFEAK